VIFHEDYIPSGRKALTVADLEGNAQADEEMQGVQDATEYLEGEVEVLREDVEELRRRLKAKDVALRKMDVYHNRVYNAVEEFKERKMTMKDCVETVEALTRTADFDLKDYEDDTGDKL